jgi:hypothetical protein
MQALLRYRACVEARSFNNARLYVELDNVKGTIRVNSEVTSHRAHGGTEFYIPPGRIAGNPDRDSNWYFASILLYVSAFDVLVHICTCMIPIVVIERYLSV